MKSAVTAQQPIRRAAKPSPVYQRPSAVYQPAKKKSILPWILLAIGILILIVLALAYLVPSCEDYDNDGFEDARCGGTDCDDIDKSIYPGAKEVCDDEDNDCDGKTDEGSVCAEEPGLEEEFIITEPEEEAGEEGAGASCGDGACVVGEETCCEDCAGISDYCIALEDAGTGAICGTYACNDCIDNDNDAESDYPSDDGCSCAIDNSEEALSSVSCGNIGSSSSDIVISSGLIIRNPSSNTKNDTVIIADECQAKEWVFDHGVVDVSGVGGSSSEHVLTITSSGENMIIPAGMTGTGSTASTSNMRIYYDGGYKFVYYSGGVWVQLAGSISTGSSILEINSSSVNAYFNSTVFWLEFKNLRMVWGLSSGEFNALGISSGVAENGELVIIPECVSSADIDNDADGYTENAGDCNDADALQ
ncbi:putative metal-binding motif-containing protein [archaeon]|nr:putative metal-binding motif-containing protein [archaeon]